MSTTAVALSLILAVIFALAGANKFSGTELANEAPAELNVAPSTWRLAGVLELIGAVCVIVGRLIWFQSWPKRRRQGRTLL